MSKTAAGVVIDAAVGRRLTPCGHGYTSAGNDDNLLPFAEGRQEPVELRIFGLTAGLEVDVGRGARGRGCGEPAPLGWGSVCPHPNFLRHVGGLHGRRATRGNDARSRRRVPLGNIYEGRSRR